MKFEELANELLIELFEFIDFIHLLRTFYDLNSRFNNLIFIHYRKYHLNFRSVSKYEFNIICGQYLPSIIDRVISLHLSNNDETPNLLELFLSHGFKFNQFYRLQFLSLDCVHSLSILNRIILECQDLLYFTHLSIIKCNFKEQDDFSYLIKNIWNLPKLKYCKIDHQFPYGLKFTNDTIISLSIENLSVENFNFDLNDLSNLFQSTPSLRHLNVAIKSHSNCEQLGFISSSIVSIKLLFRNSLHSMMNLFKRLPNLNRLTIKTQHIYLTGYDWKMIIRNYFPKIKLFQLKMDFKFCHSKNIEEQLDELVNSFRSSFWIKEHQWFVRCDCISSSMNHFGTLYTLPYAFDEFLLTNKQCSKSTTLIDYEYDRVNTLTLMNMRTNLYKDSSWFSNNFRNIYHLKIHLPLNNTFWSFIQSFNQLISLDVMLVEGCSYLPLQILLDRSPYLSSLCLGNYNNLQIISQLISSSIYRLDFIKKNAYKRYFNSTQCADLVNSSLGRQCKVLLINVENRMNILHLIKTMSNLRSLTFQCKDDQWNDELIQWLHYHLPSTCSITRDTYQTSNIRLWIF
jgi:hypothetical protein